MVHGAEGSKTREEGRKKSVIGVHRCEEAGKGGSWEAGKLGLQHMPCALHPCLTTYNMQQPQQSWLINQST